MAITMTVFRKRSENAATGSYIQRRTMLIGFLSSGRILPRMNRVIRTGVSVMARNEEKSMAKVFVIGQRLEQPVPPVPAA